MRSLIVFAKAPVKGLVKTRLLNNSPLTEDDVLKLYQAFLSDVLTLAGKSSAEQVIINFTPDNKGEMMEQLAKKFINKPLKFVPQVDGDFMARIATSFKYAESAGATSMVMIGSDSPTMQSKQIDKAFDLLDKDAEVVLGPSGEGGIYLIGIRSGQSFDYQKIFSEGAELSNFALDAKGQGLSVNLLGEVTDVDVASDLVTVISLVEAMEATDQPVGFPKHTAEVFNELKLGVQRNGGTREKVIVKGG